MKDILLTISSSSISLSSHYAQNVNISFTAVIKYQNIQLCHLLSYPSSLAFSQQIVIGYDLAPHLITFLPASPPPSALSAVTLGRSI